MKTLLSLLLCFSPIGTRTPTPAPVWDKEPTAYKKIPFGTPYAEFEGQILLTGCKPATRDHESGQRTCEGSGFQANGVSVDDVFLFQDDSFVGVSLFFAAEDYEKLREVFLVKYGEPARLETTRVTTRTGTRFDDEILHWDGRKVTVSLERYGDSLERGSATIFLNGYLEQQDRQRQERLKKEAETF
jgi:hypothetical protein